jgi:hypothetical protein
MIMQIAILRPYLVGHAVFRLQPCRKVAVVERNARLYPRLCRLKFGRQSQDPFVANARLEVFNWGTASRGLWLW